MPETDLTALRAALSDLVRAHAAYEAAMDGAVSLLPSDGMLILLDDEILLYPHPAEARCVASTTAGRRCKLSVEGGGQSGSFHRWLPVYATGGAHRDNFLEQRCDLHVGTTAQDAVDMEYRVVGKLAEL